MAATEVSAERDAGWEGHPEAAAAVQPPRPAAPAGASLTFRGGRGGGGKGFECVGGCREAFSSLHPTPPSPWCIDPEGRRARRRRGAGSAERPMSGAGEALAPGPQRGAEAGGGRLGAPAQEKCDKENTEREITQATDSCFTHGEMQDQSIWGNCSDDELIRTQPQRLPQLQTAAQESEEEISKIKHGHPSLSNGNGIHHGAKHVSAENRRLSAPVSQKMHRKLHSSLSVNSDISKKSKVNAVFSQKTGSSPEDCCVHCILACLFCEFLTLCNIVLGQASCGICTSEACCCCCGDEMGDD